MIELKKNVFYGVVVYTAQLNEWQTFPMRVKTIKNCVPDWNKKKLSLKNIQVKKSARLHATNHC